MHWLAACCLLLLAAGCATAPAPAPDRNADADAAAWAVDPPSSPDWAADMARFAAADAASPPPRDAYVFTGSSSVRMWQSLAADFPGKPVVNRGFGGSQLRDAVHYADQVAIRYRPRMILIYSGDNDIDAGRSPQQVLHDFRAFVARVRHDLPDTPIGYLAIKPSPSRADQLPRQQQANALVKAEAERLRDVEFIDVATPMLGADGQPRPELFLEDRLHMNAAGYALWRGIVSPYLAANGTTSMHNALQPAAIQALQQDSPEYRSLVDIASAPLREAFGDRVALHVEKLDRAGAWAFLQGRMQAPGGGRPDYADTDYAERAAQGGMSDVYVALLKRDGETSAGNDGGAWHLVDHAIGPSDVAWLAWPREHGVPPALLGLKP